MNTTNYQQLEMQPHLRLRVELSLTQTLMLLSKTDDTRWLVHIPGDVPDIEVFGRVHHKELTKPVHKSGATAQGLLTVHTPVVIDRAPVDLHDWQIASIAPHSDG